MKSTHRSTRPAAVGILATFVITLSSLLPIASSAQQRGGFRAAVVKVDITPDSPKMLLGYGARKSTGVHDHLYHRIVVLDDGTSQFYLVSSDICVVSPSEYDHMASLLQSQLGIKPVDFWWSLTHTHSAPELGVPGLPAVFMGNRYEHPVDTAYANFVEQKLLNGIIEARQKLAPARLGAGWGFSQANMNRRAIDVEGKASLGMNPDGPVDRRIGLIRLEKADGSILALIGNYPIHGTVLGGENLEISADVQGEVSEYVEQNIGAPMLFINGAAGNLAPIYSTYPNFNSGHLSQFRVLLGDKMLEANKNVASTTDSVKLFSGSIMVETPRRDTLTGWPADLGDYTRPAKNGGNIVRLPIRFLRINDNIGIWSAPVEMFCEVSNNVRDRSPFPYTFYYGYTNGWLGYLPSADEFPHGGYEVNMVSPYTPSVQTDLEHAVVGYLQGEMKSGLSNAAPKAANNAH